MGEAGHRPKHGGLALVFLLLSATPVVGQGNPDGWRAQTTVFFGGSTKGAQGQLPVTPMAVVRFDGSMKGFFWLGVEASWTFERDQYSLPGGWGPIGTTPYDAVLTSLIVARLVNTPSSSGMYAVGGLGRVRAGRSSYTVVGGGLGFRRQLHSKEFLVAEIRRMDGIGDRYRHKPRWEFTVGFVPGILSW